MVLDSTDIIATNRVLRDHDTEANNRIVEELLDVVNNNHFPPFGVPPGPCSRLAVRSHVSKEGHEGIPQDQLDLYGGRGLMFDIDTIVFVRVSSIGAAAATTV